MSVADRSQTKANCLDEKEPSADVLGVAFLVGFGIASEIGVATIAISLAVDTYHRITEEIARRWFPKNEKQQTAPKGEAWRR